MKSVEQWEFESLGVFYDARRERRYSPEALYGVQWRMAPYLHTWQVSYIRDTGEVYARANGGDGRCGCLGHSRPTGRENGVKCGIGASTRAWRVGRIIAERRTA